VIRWETIVKLVTILCSRTIIIHNILYIYNKQLVAICDRLIFHGNTINTECKSKQFVNFIEANNLPVHDDILTAFVCIIIIIGFLSKMAWEQGTTSRGVAATVALHRNRKLSRRGKRRLLKTVSEFPEAVFKRIN